MTAPAPTLAANLLIMALSSESDGVFEAAGVPVIYSGVGKVNAAVVLMEQLERYRRAGIAPVRVVNFGSAGSRQFPAGTLVGCSRFVQRDMDVRALGFALGQTPFEPTPVVLDFAPVFTSLPDAQCGSGDSFSTGADALPSDVVDMEAYALAKVCYRAGLRFACAKYVTDGADHAAADAWRDNVHKAAQRFLALYRRLGTD